MIDPIERWGRRRRPRYRPFDVENYEEPNTKSTMSPAELDEKRREYVFSNTSRLKPARIDDIRGMPHIVEDIKKFIAFLKDYQRFKEKNVRVQPGIFLYGQPGTGKTLTARVIATESGAKLIDAGGFPREQKGWKAGDVHSLFALAKEYYAKTKKPVIIYFDEFDEVCPDERRYRSEASPAIMTELDGISGKPEGVFVVASANSMDVDEGLLRAGRLGYHLHYRPPTHRGRAEILKFYLEKKPHEPIDLENVAEIMPEMTPAEIEELVEGAYMNMCIASSSSKLTETDLIEQLLEGVVGSRTGTWTNDDERYRACVHEAGHVIVGEQLGCHAKLVVVPKKKYKRGVTLFGSWKESHQTPEKMERRLAVAYGGGIAEEIVFGERDLGCTADVGEATELSIKLVAKWANKSNYWNTSPEEPTLHHPGLLIPLNDGERSRIYSEAHRIRERSYRRAKEILEQFGKENVEYVAKQIAEREFLLKRDVKRVIEEARNGSNAMIEENYREKGVVKND